ncbi:MAG TPA: helix-turn-helix domain-containing protein [Yinghuangia sp.]|nr:helix-turn-helix domain-containing protein [Yinghuangia sp.]
MSGRSTGRTGTSEGADRPGGPELELFHLLRAVTVEYGLRQAEFAAANGMHPTDVRALICLLDAERAGTEATAGMLAARLGLNSAGTTAALDRLELQGLITRHRDKRDRRRVLLVIEDRAKDLGWSWFGPLIERTVAPLRGYDRQQTDAVRGFLQAALDALGRPEAPGEQRTGRHD